MTTTMQVDAVAVLWESGRLVLTGASARRGRALEIRKQAKATGLCVTFRKSGRTIEMRVVADGDIY
jgi:hypothetical protein